jgi:hypothetical protein
VVKGRGGTHFFTGGLCEVVENSIQDRQPPEESSNLGSSRGSAGRLITYLQHSIKILMLKITLRWIMWKMGCEDERMRGRWNWLWIVSNG